MNKNTTQKNKPTINSTHVVLSEAIENSIYDIRGQKVILDRDLAKLYGVTTGNFNKAVKRNIERFPEEFMFQLTKEELKNWIFQYGRSNSEKMGMRKFPYVFTEYGVLMAANILRSDTAIGVSIEIIKTFSRLRKIVTEHKEIMEKIARLEKKYDQNFQVVFKAIQQMFDVEAHNEQKKFGFIPREK